MQLVNKLRAKNICPGWRTILGNKQLPITGVTELKFKLHNLSKNGLQLGFCSKPCNFGGYFAEKSNGYAL